MGPIPADIKRSIGLTPDSKRLDPSVSPRPILWGTGEARREFLYSTDMADACIYLMSLAEIEFNSLLSNYIPPLVNIGCGIDQTIAACVDMIKLVIGYEGEIEWDQDKPNGTPQKLLDVSRLNALGWKARYSLKEGIFNTYEAFLQEQKK